MSGNKLVCGFLSVASAWVLILIMLFTIIDQCVFDLNFFRSEFQKLESTKVIGISEKDLMSTTEVLLTYIKGDRDDLNISAVIKGQERQVFNQKETEHMGDVQRLYIVGHGLRNVGLLVLLLLILSIRYVAGKKYLRCWAGGYLVGSAIFLCLITAVFLAIFRDFQEFWNSLHSLVFTNDLWLLDPETDILIQIVPEQFFLDLVSRILSFFSIAVILVGILAYKIRKGVNKNVKV